VWSIFDANPTRRMCCRSFFFAASMDGSVRAWADRHSKLWANVDHGHSAAVVTLEAKLGVDGEALLWTGSEDGTLSLFRVASRGGTLSPHKLGTYSAHHDTVGCLLLVGDSDLLRFRLKGVLPAEVEGGGGRLNLSCGRFEVGDRIEAQFGDEDEGYYFPVSKRIQ
jgi:hypothetical protein